MHDRLVMNTATLTPGLVDAVNTSLTRATSTHELRALRDIALVLCGARPAAYLWEAGPATTALVDMAEAAGFAVGRWDDDGGRPYVAIAYDETTRDAVVDLAQRELVGPLSTEDEAALGEWLGYPALSVMAYTRTSGARTGDMLVELRWSADERRFLLCRHGATPDEELAGREWTRWLRDAFAAAYGSDAIERLPIQIPHSPRR